MGKIDLSKTEVGVATEFENAPTEEVTSIGGGLAIDGETERPRAVAFSLVINDTPYVFSDSAMQSLIQAVMENAERIRHFRQIGIPNPLED